MITVLNAPPNAGKDTIADLLVKMFNFKKMMFKTHLYRLTADYYKMDVDELIKVANNRTQKEISMAKLQFKSPREALIHVSENIYKPVHGEDFFGKLAAQDAFESDHSNIVFSDGGFSAEVRPLTKEPVLIVRLYGRGTFKHDSRDYIQEKDVVADYKGHCPEFLDVTLIEDKPELAVQEIVKELLR